MYIDQRIFKRLEAAERLITSVSIARVSGIITHREAAPDLAKGLGASTGTILLTPKESTAIGSTSSPTATPLPA